MLNDVVNVRNGSGLVLWMTPREQNIKPADGTEGAHSICADGMSLMQLPRAPQRLLRDYVRDFSLGDLDTTWWIHDMSNELVQMHPDICRIDVNLDVEIQCRDLWMLRGLPEHCRVTPIDPAPIFIALPRPHLIVTPTFAPFEVPILCHVTIDGRANLLSMVLTQDIHRLELRLFSHWRSPKTIVNDQNATFFTVQEDTIIGMT